MPKATWFGHPRGLTILFATEMWACFSYYGMRALLVYYMTRQLGIAAPNASLIYGAYVAGAFLTPIFGGIVCDRWLGRHRSVLLGGAIMALGHGLMTFESLFYPALATVAIGNGLFLPSLPSQIPGLYPPDDRRRQRAYGVYYVGINVGGFLAPLACGTVGELIGWHWGFGLAGIGMLLGLAIYALGGAYLPPDPPRRRDDTQRGRLAPRSFLLLAQVACAVIVFRAAYEQQGNALALWIGDSVDRSVGDFVIPMTWFQSLNALLVFSLTPLLLQLWAWREARGRNFSSIARMSIGAFFVMLAYLLLFAVTVLSDGAASWIWPVLFFVVLTWGELHILPVGLGLFGRLAPAGFAATMIAAWFFAGFVGNLAAGVLGSWWSALGPQHFFPLMAVIAGVAGLALAALERSGRAVEAAGPLPSPVTV